MKTTGDILLSPEDTPSGVLRWIRDYLKRDLPQGPCPVGIAEPSKIEARRLERDFCNVIMWGKS